MRQVSFLTHLHKLRYEVFITVDKRERDGAIQVSIERNGVGYRIAGPKYDGAGQNLLRKPLTRRDVEEIRWYLERVPLQPDQPVV